MRTLIYAEEIRSALRYEEVAHLWGTSKRHVQDLVAMGKLRTVKVGNRSPRISIDELHRFLTR